MINQQMRQTIEDGVQGWFDGCFAGGAQPLDPYSGYPLTPDNSEVQFLLQYPYEALQDAYLAYLQCDDSTALTEVQLQAWAAYYWQYCRLMLWERLALAPNDPLTPEMIERREGLAQELIEKGYKRIS
jgi:hypothetical protein